MHDDRPLELIDGPAALEALARRLQGQPRLAVDTEGNSFHAYAEQVCVIQISTPDEDAILDMVALQHPGPVGELLTDPGCLKLLHGADFDVVSLKRDYGLAIAPLFDSAIACQLLGIEHFGLAALAERFAGVTLDKRFQRADWARRPLAEEQIAYLRNDTRHLFAIADALQAEIEAADLGEEARLEYARLEAREWTGRPFEPDRWVRIKGATDLDDEGRGVLRALYALRNELAREANRPPFKTLSDGVLLQLARKRPGTGAKLSRIHGIPSSMRMRATQRLLDAVDQGRRDAEQGPIDLPRRSPKRQRPSPSAEKRAKRLKLWRSQIAEQQGRTTLAVLPNPLLNELADDPPADLAALAARSGLGQGRLDRYGPAILEVLSEGR